MPFQVERDDAAKRIVAIGEGEFRPEDVIQVLNSLRDSVAWSYGMLFDGRRMTGTSTVAAIKPISDLTAADTRGPLAIVVTSPALYGMACAYATLSKWDRIQVFRERPEAERWLAAEMASPS